MPSHETIRVEIVDPIVITIPRSELKPKLRYPAIDEQGRLPEAPFMAEVGKAILRGESVPPRPYEYPRFPLPEPVYEAEFVVHGVASSQPQK